LSFHNVSLVFVSLLQKEHLLESLKILLIVPTDFYSSRYNRYPIIKRVSDKTAKAETSIFASSKPAIQKAPQLYASDCGA